MDIEAGQHKEREGCARHAAACKSSDHGPVDRASQAVDQAPPVLVAAAKSRSVPTAVAGWTPNNRISSGVMSDPPPTPVIPTSRPPTNPQTEYSGFIACMAGFRALTVVAMGAGLCDNIGIISHHNFVN
jgi:hypothetical protein